MTSIKKKKNRKSVHVVEGSETESVGFRSTSFWDKDGSGPGGEMLDGDTDSRKGREDDMYNLKGREYDKNARRQSASTTDTAALGLTDMDQAKVSYANRKTRQSIGGYTSLFMRKLLPPLGFYREADKYVAMKERFWEDFDKLDVLEEMWQDYKKYQIRKRFRWPPNLIFNKFFWTTGYYADYQKKHRATALRKPGEDSSEEEFIDPEGQFFVAGLDGDINLAEFERYRQAKNMDPDKARRYTRYDINPYDEGGKKKRKSKKPTSEADEKSEKSVTETEEVETIVEYSLVPNPNKRKSRKSRKSIKGILAPTTEEVVEAMKEAEAGGGPPPPVLGRRRSVVLKTITMDKTTGEKKIDVKEKEDVVDIPDYASVSDAPTDTASVSQASKKRKSKRATVAKK